MKIYKFWSLALLLYISKIIDFCNFLQILTKKWQKFDIVREFVEKNKWKVEIEKCEQNSKYTLQLLYFFKEMLIFGEIKKYYN